MINQLVVVDSGSGCKSQGGSERMNRWCRIQHPKPNFISCPMYSSHGFKSPLSYGCHFLEIANRVHTLPNDTHKSHKELNQLHCCHVKGPPRYIGGRW